MAQKLLTLNVSPRLITWIISFLVHRSQSVCFQHVLSSTKITSIGSPQGTVLSPILFTLYTNDCIGSEDCPLIKYSDDSAIVDLSNSDNSYFEQVTKFSAWCKDNCLDLNVEKTKEMLIDFRKQSSAVPDLLIDGKRVERVPEYKYLGTILDEKLNFTANTNYINKKCQSRIYCLQKLRNLHINTKVLEGFYRCFLESVLSFSFICWFGNLSLKNKNILNKIVNVCSKTVGVKQVNLTELYERRVKVKARKIVSESSHTLAEYYVVLPSGKRFRCPKQKTLRYKNSFIPRSIQLLNT